MKIAVNQIQLNVEVEGEGAALLLLHGFTGSAAAWSPFVPVWSSSYKLIRVDLIGHGKSDCPENARRYSMENAMADLTAILDALGIEKMILCGYSMGGRVALSWAVCNPDRVEALILESSSPGLQDEAERAARIRQDEELAAWIEQQGIQKFVERWENLPLFESQKRLPEQVRDAIRKQRLGNDPAGLAGSLRGMGTGAQPSWWERLPDITFPTLLIAGQLDRKFCEIARRMQAEIPVAELYRVRDSGHAVHVEQPSFFGTIVRDFLHTRLRK